MTPIKINAATEHKENYKLISLFLMDSYNGLHPSLLSKISHIIFNSIIYNKLYRKPENRYYSLEEDKRIYNNILITPEDLLKRIYPAKYSENKDISNDISNLTSRLQTLEDNNIFYIWRYKQPYTYMFFMERDVGCWKYYNNEAFITPKTLKKIISSGRCIIDTMVKMEGKREREINRQDIEKSFGNFINRMIDKLNPSVIPELSRWTDKADINSYLIRITSDLREIEDFKGQVIASDFMKKLPEPVRNEIVNKKTKDNKGDKMDMTSLELELVPQNGNVTSIKKIRTANKKINNEAPASIAKRFDTIDPFENSLSLTKYYRSILKNQNPEAKFYNTSYESQDAQLILDMLIKNGRSGDMKFLKMWILNYYALNLKGNNIYKAEKTTIKGLAGTFNQFNGSYYG